MNSSIQRGSGQWMLFGYDMRRIGQQWLSAWRDLLFSVDSPLRRRLDEPVLLCDGKEERVYQGGELLANSDEVAAPQCRALLVPPELVLSRLITIPVAAEAEIASVVDIEASSSSPFPSDDTIIGWRETGRGPWGIRVALVIAARSGLAPWLEKQGVSASGSELWAESDGGMVTLMGFAEDRRGEAYRRRLLRCGVSLAGVLFLLLLAGSLLALHQSFALERSRDRLSAIDARAKVANSARADLLAANEFIVAANQLVDDHPNPHIELARLTRLLGDEAFISHFALRGRALRVRGRAADAAGVMKTLADESVYSSVTAPQAITAVGNSGQQQFYLDIDVAQQNDGAVEAGP